MYKIDYIVPENLEPFVNCIMIDESENPDSETSIPIYADGYPGIMFQQSESGMYQEPKGKELSELFLFGQTITPFTLEMKGKFNFVVVQLYPFASKYLLDIDPKVLNDDCYDLLQLKHIDIFAYRKALVNSVSLDEKVKIIYKLMVELIQHNTVPDDDQIQKAIELILKHKGLVRIKDLTEELYITERTFERNFVSQVGLTPKQFSKIIQFQSSLHNLTQSNYNKLTDISHDSGFADQSHFIRTFKKYTGQTPSYYLNNMAQ